MTDCPSHGRPRNISARPGRIRTLFATHYHEMTVLEETLKGVRNLNVDVAEENGDVVFLHKIVEGSASRSYGIHVARLAGAPKELLENAQVHLDSLSGDMGTIAEVVWKETTSVRGNTAVILRNGAGSHQGKAGNPWI